MKSLGGVANLRGCGFKGAEAGGVGLPVSGSEFCCVGVGEFGQAVGDDGWFASRLERVERWTVCFQGL